MKTILSWSGGKECAMALFETLGYSNFTVSALLTTVTEDYDRISMHGVRTALIERQADSIGLPLIKVLLPRNCSQEKYGSIMTSEMMRLSEEGITSVIFGDVFLQDVRKYREDNLGKVGMKGLFPLWQRNTHELAREFLHLGFKAIVTCVDSKVLEKRFVGRVIDHDFLSELPDNIDPCGENGEYHSFVFDGPIFKKRIAFSAGKIVLRNSLYFCDLMPE